MDELVRIIEQDFEGEKMQAVNAREVWAFLEVKTEFSHWIKRRIAEAKLVVGQDFIQASNLTARPQGGPSVVDYILSLDAAKHVGMMEGNDKGHELRQYFINVEKAARKASQALQEIEEDPLVVMARNHVALQREQQRQAIELAEHRLRIEEQRY